MSVLRFSIVTVAVLGLGVAALAQDLEPRAYAISPIGVNFVYSFKAPSSEELDHTGLWRDVKSVPERGRSCIFNRSHYEDVLVLKVHKQLLAKQKLPSECLKADHVWKDRYEDINAFEQHLARNGTVIVKIFLHLSKEEQKQRFLKRLERLEKHWKFSEADPRRAELLGRLRGGF